MELEDRLEEAEIGQLHEDELFSLLWAAKQQLENRIARSQSSLERLKRRVDHIQERVEAGKPEPEPVPLEEEWVELEGLASQVDPFALGREAPVLPPLQVASPEAVVAPVERPAGDGMTGRPALAAEEPWVDQLEAAVQQLEPVDGVSQAEYQGLVDRVDDLRREAAAKAEELQALQLELAQARAEVEEERRRADDLDSRLPALEDEVERGEGIVEALRQEVDALRAEIQQHQATIGQLEPAKEAAHVEYQKLAEKLNDFRREAAEKEEELAALQFKLVHAETQVGEKLRQADDLGNQLPTLEGEVQKRQEIVTLLRQEAKRLREEIQWREATIGELEPAMETARGEYQRLVDRVEGFRFVAAIKDEEMNGLHLKLAQAEAEFEQKQRQADGLEERLHALEEEVEKRQQVLMALRQEAKGLQAEIRQQKAAAAHQGSDGRGRAAADASKDFSPGGGGTIVGNKQGPGLLTLALICLGVLLLSAGAFFSYPYVTSRLRGGAAAAAGPGTLTSDRPGASIGFSNDDTAPLRGNDAPAAAAEPTPMPTLRPELASSTMPTRLIIPTIGLDALIVPVSWDPVQEQWQVPTMYAVGWHADSALLGVPGNTVLNGHNATSGEVFRDLYRLGVGDQIVVFSNDQTFSYLVSEVLILPEAGQPEEVRLYNARYLMPTDDERLTLVTCHPYGSLRNRLVVIAFPEPEGYVEGSLDSASGS